jgi:hypothetical protein
LRTSTSISRLSVGLLGGALISGCGLGDLVFDRDGPEGASTASGGAAAGCISSPSSNGGAGGAAEDCSNGLDDDGDGAVDCGDSDCGEAGFSCVRVPKDWNGPGVFYEGDPTTVPCCPSAFPNVVSEGGDKPRGDAATCASCTCEADASCKPGALGAYLDKACNDTLLPMPQDAQCRPLSSVVPFSEGFSAAPPTFTVGTTCKKVGGGMSSRLPPTWSIAARICGAPTGSAGCKGGTVCAGPALDLFVNALCVWQAGRLDCPQGFPKKHAFFSDFDDSRTCSDCSCGQPETGGSCSVTTRLYSDQGCGESKRIGQLDNPVSCFQKNGAVAYDAEISVKPPGCPSSGNTPSGGVEPKAGTETTVCCAP